MTTNMSNLDRAARLVVGAVLIALALGLHDPANLPASKMWWGWIGVIPIVTALIGWCPLYRVFGFSTCKKAD